MSKQIEQVWMGTVENTALGTIWTAVSENGLVHGGVNTQAIS